MTDIQRCPWPGRDELMLLYHDEEWGVQLHEDRKLFEFLVLDAFQAGLSWSCVLHKRKNFREAFDDFDPLRIAAYDETKMASLLEYPGTIRNRLKIAATISNARAFLEIQREFGSFDHFIWQFTGGNAIVNAWTEESQIPTRSSESDAMSRELKRCGFKFVGSTICYAFMQAAGMVNDHLISCFRHQEVQHSH